MILLLNYIFYQTKKDSMIQKYIDKLDLRKLLDFSSGVKILLGALLGIITGSSIFYKILEIITYVYCRKEGVRLPAEGIDILNPVSFYYGIGIGVFCGIFLLLIGSLKFLLGELDKKERIEIRRISRNREIRAAKWCLIFFLSYTGIFIFLKIFFQYPIFEFEDLYLFGVKNTALKALVYIPLSIASTIYVVLKRNFLMIFGFAVCLNVFLSSAITFGKSSNYEEFLAQTKYGGGISVKIKQDCKNDLKCNFDIEGRLMLRTKKFLFIKNSRSEIFEIPIANLISIQYK